MKSLFVRFLAFTIFQLIRLKNWIEPPQYRVLCGFRRVAAMKDILGAAFDVEDVRIDPTINARNNYDLEEMKQQILDGPKMKPIKVKKRKKR